MDTERQGKSRRSSISAEKRRCGEVPEVTGGEGRRRRRVRSGRWRRKRLRGNAPVRVYPKRKVGR